MSPTPLSLTLSGPRAAAVSLSERVARVMTAVEPAEDTSVLQPSWPTLAPAARHGLAGKFLELVEPETEADPAALLATFLATFGAFIGAGPHAVADGAEHPARPWPLIVGDTSKSRKGTSWAQVRRVLAAADKRFAADRVLAGFGSGEALVDAVAGDQDRRLLVVETEYGRVLSVCKREGSTLATLQRQAWDGGRLQVRSRAGTAVADEAHVVMVAHITRDELLAKLAESDAFGGSLNRFLLVAARRSKLLPSGGNLNEADITDFGRKVAFVATQARTAGILRRTPDGERYWTQVYESLADDDPGGLLGAVIARDAAQVLRLSVCYALMDGARLIDFPHIMAGVAIWEYSRASAAMIFGERTGDVIADRVLNELQSRGPEGMDGTAIRDLLRHHARKERIEQATDLLVQRGLATKATKPTHGRPRTVLRLATEATKATKVEDEQHEQAEPLGYDDFGSLSEEPPDDETQARWADEAEALRQEEAIL